MLNIELFESIKEKIIKDGKRHNSSYFQRKKSYYTYSHCSLDEHQYINQPYTLHYNEYNINIWFGPFNLHVFKYTLNNYPTLINDPKEIRQLLITIYNDIC